MSTNWRKNEKVHLVDLKFNQNSTESVQTAALDPSGKAAGFANVDFVPDKDTSKNEAEAEAFFYGANLAGLNVGVGWGTGSKLTEDYAGAMRPKIRKQNKFGDSDLDYGEQPAGKVNRWSANKSGF